MKKIIILVFFMFSILLSEKASIKLNPRNNPFHSYLPGLLEYQHAIPRKPFFFQLPPCHKLVNLKSSNHKSAPNAYPVFKPQIPSRGLPLQRTKLPFQARLNYAPVHYGYGKVGPYAIGYLSYPSISSKKENMETLSTEKISIQYETKAIEKKRDFKNTYATTKILRSLFPLENIESNFQDIGYLLIYPQTLQESFLPLARWRRRQGFRVHTLTMENIISEENGRDGAEKLRNRIIKEVESHGISFVTLGGKEPYIPIRKAFAFDCEYGAYPDENEIPCDMYYCCLNGTWDANENSVFGEEGDEIDFFPDVFVSRIIYESQNELENYVERLLEYEKGQGDYYEKAGGFSMELWEGSNSEICQQFIYDKYFPSRFQIVFFYGDSNTETNVFSSINSGLNLCQHTGHANVSVISLQNGGINFHNTRLFNSTSNGLFYSIGCWSAAFDRTCIAEKLISPPSPGFLAYVGNSRYGWGSPAASAFGFSEYFHKEFFKLLFSAEVPYLAELNQNQKSPFIPFYDGKSVYKWVGYELNALGDACFAPILKNPEAMTIDYTFHNDTIQLQLRDSSSRPLSGATISNSDFTTIIKSGKDGRVFLPLKHADHFTFYKYGYKTRDTLITSEDQTYALINRDPASQIIEIRDSINIRSSLLHSGNSEKKYIHRFVYDSSIFHSNFQPETLILNANEEKTLGAGIFTLKPHTIDLSEQNIISETVYPKDNPYESRVISHSYLFEAPRVHIQQAEEDSSNLYLILRNNSIYQIDSVFIQFDSSFQDLLSETESSLNMILPGDIDTIKTKVLDREEIKNRKISLFVTTYYQGYTFRENYLLQINYGGTRFLESFSDLTNWKQKDTYWKLVDVYSNSAPYSLSCKPEENGDYSLSSPSFPYNDSMALSFEYRYKMPMYGHDGFYLLYESGSIKDTLLFLGSGGALKNTTTPRTYIHSNWKEYSLNIGKHLKKTPQPGELFNITFLFHTPLTYEGYNDYGRLDSIGIFIDDFSLTSPEMILTGINESPLKEEPLSIYPNPVGKNDNLQILSPRNIHKIEIFNLLGRKFHSLQIAPSKKATIQGKTWDSLGSGIYFIKVHDNKGFVIKKITYLD